MKRCVLVLLAFLLIPVGSASAGTYDVVACHAPGADMRNLSWAFETFNAAGKPVPAASSFPLAPDPSDTCSSGSGVLLTTLPNKQAVNVDDGAAWVFRAPAGATVKRVQIWRTAATRVSVDDAATGGVENGWWTLFARAGDAVAGRVVLGGETCPGNTPTAPDTLYCRKGNANYPATAPVSYDIGEPVVSWGVQCVGPTTTSLCFTGNGAERLAYLYLQAAIVTVDDPIAPVVAVRVCRRRPPAHEPDVHRERLGLGGHPDAAGAGRRRRARRRALRLRLPPDRALRAGALARLRPRRRGRRPPHRDHRRRGRREQPRPHRADHRRRRHAASGRPGPRQRPPRLGAGLGRRLGRRGRDDRGARRPRQGLRRAQDDAPERPPDRDRPALAVDVQARHPGLGRRPRRQRVHLRGDIAEPLDAHRQGPRPEGPQRAGDDRLRARRHRSSGS